MENDYRNSFQPHWKHVYLKQLYVENNKRIKFSIHPTKVLITKNENDCV